MIGDLFDSPWKILIVAIVLIVLFGSAKLPVAARSLGRSMRILKSEVSGLHDDDETEAAGTQATAQPSAARAPQQIAAAPQPAAAADPAAQQHISNLEQQIRELKEKQTTSVPADQKQA